MSGNDWAVVVAAAKYATERLYAFDTLVLRHTRVLSGAAGSAAEVASPPRSGDRVALIAATEPPVIFGLGVVEMPVSARPKDDLEIAYTRRVFDDPPRVEALFDGPSAGEPPGVEAVTRPLTAAEFDRLSGLVPAEPSRELATQWFVSVALPVEAVTRADAVREFWTYVRRLGPQELPAYVWPGGDELAMQAYLLGDETDLDPEQ